MNKKILLFICFVIININIFPSVDKWDDNKSDWTELMFEVYNGDILKVRQLIKNGADLNFHSKKGWRVCALEIAIRKQFFLCVEALLSTKKVKIEENPNLLIVASEYSDARIIKQLVDYDYSINYISQGSYLPVGYTPLITACRFGSDEIVEYLVQNKVDINYQMIGDTALMISSYYGYLNKVKILLKYGADKKIKNKLGHDALYNAKLYNPYKSKETIAELIKLLE